MKRDYVFVGVLACLMLIATIVGLLCVNMPAIFDGMVLSNNSAANIGSAIGGISTLIVGVANVGMLYLTFRSQMRTLQLQEKKMAKRSEAQRRKEELQNKYLKMEKEKNEMLIKKVYERNEELFMNNRLNNIKFTWIKLFSIETNASKGIDMNVLVFNMKSFLLTLEVVDNRFHLVDMRSIFDTYIRYFYSTYCNKNHKFMEEYKAIEALFRDKEEKFNKKRG